ncbi:MAG: TIGR02452 family protein [Nannocystaceae bacterium]
MSLKGVAKQTLALLEAGKYVAPSGARVSIARAQAAAVARSRLYTPDEVAALVAEAAPGGALPMIELTAETTQEASRRLCLAGDADVVALNFASARNPGGGFLKGARAQEEELCRCSGLYPALLEHRTYYEVNRAESSLIYTDHMIYAPGVPFFRVHSRDELLEEPFLVGVISAPAPNAGPLLRRDPSAGPAIRAAFTRRWCNVLAVAEANGGRRLVLGAWGCGAFHNDPRIAAESLAEALDSGRFNGSFDQITLAIPDRGKSSDNLRAFRICFSRF